MLRTATIIAAALGVAMLLPGALGAQQASVTASVTIVPAVSSELTAQELSIMDGMEFTSPLLRDAAPGRAAAIVTRQLVGRDDTVFGEPDASSGPRLRFTIAVDS